MNKESVSLKRDQYKLPKLQHNRGKGGRKEEGDKDEKRETDCDREWCIQ